jgi:hypothetical protein
MQKGKIMPGKSDNKKIGRKEMWNMRGACDTSNELKV